MDFGKWGGLIGAVAPTIATALGGPLAGMATRAISSALFGHQDGSMDDIQNIQILASRPEIYCSPEFQGVIDPLMKLVPIRLVLELLGIPSAAAREEGGKAAVCAAYDGQSISDTITEKLTPTVEPLEEEAATEPPEEKAEEEIVPKKGAADEEPKATFKPQKTRKQSKQKGGQTRRDLRRRSRRNSRSRRR